MYRVRACHLTSVDVWPEGVEWPVFSSNLQVGHFDNKKPFNLAKIKKSIETIVSSPKVKLVNLSDSESESLKVRLATSVTH